MGSHRLCGLCLALLLAGLPVLAKPLPGEYPMPRLSFLSRLWDQVRDLLPRFAEIPPPPSEKSASNEGNFDLGLGMDPNG